MTLPGGSRLGPYEVLSLIGAGGMGEVYRARDTRLGRTVAIKVLPATASSDPDRRRRFEQEARAVSALSHPNICVLHDIGSTSSPQAAGGATIDFLVMELLEGHTLAHRLRKGPLSLEQALDLGAQIADGLAAAHKHGIVHRDLKPANIMLVRSGAGLQAKLLDFGLAKLKAEPVPPGDGVSALPTEGPATTPGAVMGTAPYMAPEQLEGKEADARTNLFAFGCVLYEMLTGRRAFAGESEASVISAIMTSEPPPVSSLQPVTPPALARLVKACLAKDPDARRQSAHDVAEELRGIAEGGQTTAPGRASHARRRGRLVWAGAGALLVILVATLVALSVGSQWWDRKPVRTEIALPRGTVFIADGTNHLALAPDGSGLVYRAFSREQHRLYWRRLDETAPQVIPGSEGGSQPFFSPDGKYLGFMTGEKLVKLALPSGQPGDGGPIEPVAEIGSAGVRGASWGDDGTILYTPGSYAGLWRVPASGGRPQELTRPDPANNEQSHRWPCFLPGGRAALFTIHHASGRQDRSAIAVVSLDDGKWRRIVEHGSGARYLPTGHVVFARNGSLFAVRFDPRAATTTGEPVAVATGVLMHRRSTGAAFFDVSRSGSLVVARSDGPPKGVLVWVDRQGRVEPVTADPRAYNAELALSRDGSKLAVSIIGPEYDNLWAYHVHEQRWQQFTSAADEEYPLWSPGGDRLAFASNRDGPLNIYVAQSDGERAERLTTSPRSQVPISWSPDGRFIAYQEGFAIWILPLDGDRKPWRWGPEPLGYPFPVFSPDGRWVAYQSLETGGDPLVGNFNVHVRPFPGPGPRQTVSGPDGGVSPVWSPDGRELLYMPGSATDNRIMAVDVSPGSPLKLANPHVAFALPFGLWSMHPFALAPDGQRLVMVRRDEGIPTEVQSLALVRNWAQEVKAKVR